MAFYPAADAQDRISAAEASKHIGKRATVCGGVASVTYAPRSQGRPTFLNLDRPYPNHIFTALIWGQHRSRFSPAPATAFRGKNICVTGVISSHKGEAQIVVSDPTQIEIQK